jgi:hypothetical protein
MLVRRGGQALHKNKAQFPSLIVPLVFMLDSARKLASGSMRH